MSNAMLRSLTFRVLVVFSVGIAMPAVAKEVSAPAQPPVKPARFAAEIEAFEKWDRQNSWPREAVLFVGSSSVRLWQTAKSFPELAVINRGFGGSQIADVNHYFDRIVSKYKPRVIVFYSGDNDIAAGKSPQSVAEDFFAFVRRVEEELPATQVLYVTTKPSRARIKLWPKMKEVNDKVAKFQKEHANLAIVDIATPMLDAAGQPRNELFLKDGLHLNAEGYKVWNEQLAPALRSAVSAR